MLCSGYDTHLILSAVKPRHGKITVIYCAKITALHVLYNQRLHIHRVVSIYDASIFYQCFINSYQFFP